MYDAHTHLNSDQLYPDRQLHLDKFAAAGGQGLVNIGVNHDWNLKGVHIASQAKRTHPDIYVGCTIGIHPCEVSFGEISSSADIVTHISQLTQLYMSHKDTPDIIVGVGECGIDAHHERNDDIQKLQVELFHAQCNLARDRQLPIVIHSRSHFDLTYEVLSKYTDLQVYIHCRGYTPTHLQTLIDTFPQLRVGRCANTTYPASVDIQTSLDLAITQNVQILLETDAPYLLAHTLKKEFKKEQKRAKKSGLPAPAFPLNTPANISHLYDRVHDRHPDVDIGLITKNSFETLYR